MPLHINNSEMYCMVSLSLLVGCSKRVLQRFCIFAEEPCKSTTTTTEPCRTVFKEAHKEFTGLCQINVKSVFWTTLTDQVSQHFPSTWVLGTFYILIETTLAKTPSLVENPVSRGRKVKQKAEFWISSVADCIQAGNFENIHRNRVPVGNPCITSISLHDWFPLLMFERVVLAILLYCFWDNLLVALIGTCVWHFRRKCQL